MKAIGIFAVIFGHICTVQPVLDWLYTFHVPLFFIAGGVLFRPRDIFTDIRRRAFRIIVPYLFFGIIIAVYYSLIERPWREVDMSFTDCLAGLLIGDMKHLEFHSHLWFLPCYFLTTVVYNVLYRLINPAACRAVLPVWYMCLCRYRRCRGAQTECLDSLGCLPLVSFRLLWA